jgi:hypothetical protein
MGGIVKVSELIAVLTDLIDRHGDLEVVRRREGKDDRRLEIQTSDIL